MGSPGSPSYAICICAYYEHLLHEKLTQFEDTTEDLTPRVKGLRYIDDVLIIVAWNKQDHKTEERAQTILEMIRHETYHEFMKLKLEDTSKPFCFLEGVIDISQTTTHPDEIMIKYNNKNFKHLIDTGKIKFHTLQHRGSFITKSQAQAKIIGQLYRMERVVCNDKNLIRAIQEWSVIANKLQYTNHEILTAMGKMVKKNAEKWLDIYSFFKSKTEEVSETGT